MPRLRLLRRQEEPGIAAKFTADESPLLSSTFFVRVKGLIVCRYSELRGFVAQLLHRCIGGHQIASARGSTWSKMATRALD